MLQDFSLFSIFVWQFLFKQCLKAPKKYLLVIAQNVRSAQSYTKWPRNNLLRSSKIVWTKTSVFRSNAKQSQNSPELIQILICFITICHGWPCKEETLQDFPLFSIFVWQSSLCIVVAGNVVENTCPRGSDSRLKYRITLVTYY